MALSILKKLQKLFLPNMGTILLMASMLFAYNAWAAPSAQNPIPGVISYQGILTDDAGQPITDNVDLTFRFYDLPTDGTALWTEAHTETNAVPVQNGLFHVLLGSLNPISSTVWSSSSLYLGVQVSNESEMLPREVISTVPIALSVVNGSITPEKLAFTSSRFVPVQPDGNALHLSGKSSQDWTDFDLSPYVTPQTYAVSLEITVEDTAGAGAQLLVRHKGYTGADYGPAVRSITRIEPSINDVIVGCDESQMIQYKIIAVGSETATVRIRVTGYWEYIE